MQHVAMDKLKGRQVIKPRYDNFIGGKWVAPVRGQYFTNLTPITGQAVLRDRPLDRRGHRTGARRRARGHAMPGARLGRRARAAS